VLGSTPPTAPGEGKKCHGLARWESLEARGRAGPTRSQPPRVRPAGGEVWKRERRPGLSPSNFGPCRASRQGTRGNERKPFVRDDANREKRLDWLQRTVETYGWRLHAFVLMRNHDHLFVETPHPDLSAGMQYLNGSYTS
jgi:hypothetical protein